MLSGNRRTESGMALFKRNHSLRPDFGSQSGYSGQSSPSGRTFCHGIGFLGSHHGGGQGADAGSGDASGRPDRQDRSGGGRQTEKSGFHFHGQAFHQLLFQKADGRPDDQSFRRCGADIFLFYRRYSLFLHQCGKYRGYERDHVSAQSPAGCGVHQSDAGAVCHQLSHDASLVALLRQETSLQPPA